MKRALFHRALSMLLALLVAVSVCVAGTVAAEEETRDLAFKTWGPQELNQAGEAVGTKNSHNYPVYTYFYDVIGRRSKSAADLFIANATIPHEFNGERSIYNGKEYMIYVRLMASDNYEIGNLCLMDLLYGVEEYGTQYRMTYDVTQTEYEQAFQSVDETYGYEYKELAIPFTLDDEIYDEENLKNLEFRIWAAEDDVQISVYSIDIMDMEDNLLNSYSGPQMRALGGRDYTFEYIYSDSSNPSGLVSYSGVDQGCMPGRGEPMSLYNGDGLDRSIGQKYLMVDGLGETLAAGNYAYSFHQASMFSLGGERVYYTVTDATTNQVVTELNVNMNMVEETVGKDSGTFEYRRVPFTVTEANAGHKFTFQVYIYNQTDYYLRSASLNLVVDNNSAVPEDAQKVIDAITNLDVTDADAIASARAEYEKLDMLGQGWVGAELENKLSTAEKAIVAAPEVNQAIAALGNKDDLTVDNYTDKTEALLAAERAVQIFTKTYGEEFAIPLLDLETLTAYREAYDAVEKQANSTQEDRAIQAAIDAIDAIGPAEEITAENLAEKQPLVNTAREAADALVENYGQEVLDKVTNYADLLAAEAKVDELAPDVTLGDVNMDTRIDAADALMVLQHAVKLITLEGDEIIAADVNVDTAIDAADALKILQYTVNLIDKF